MPITIERSPRTHWNGGRTERRVLRDGRYVRPDADAIALRRLIFGAATNADIDRAQSAVERLARARATLGL
jgi:hypothetical protein